MSVTAQDVAARLLRQAAEDRKRSAARAEQLTALLPRLRAVLLRRGAEEVWLFGSLAQGGFTEGSDVDLATRGLPKESYFDALAELMTEAGAAVDLVRIEEAPSA